MESNGRKKKQITLTFYEDEWFQVFRHYCFVVGCVRRKQRIPSKVVENLFHYFTATDLDETIIRESILAIIESEVIKYFQNKEGYNFDIKLKCHPPTNDGDGNVQWPLSFKEMIDHLFRSLEVDKNYKTISEKATAIPFIYLRLKQYLPKPHEEIITDYRLRVITAFITAKLGVKKVKTEKEFAESDIPGHYTQYLHKQADYLCNKSQGKI